MPGTLSSPKASCTLCNSWPVTFGRAKVIQITRNGQALLQHAGASVDAAWQQHGKLFGEKPLAKFRDELQNPYRCVRDGGRKKQTR